MPGQKLEEHDTVFASVGDKVVSAIGIDVGSKFTNDELKAALRRAKARQEILVLYGHAPLSIAGDNDIYKFDPERLELVLHEAKLLGLRFLTGSEVARD